MSGLRAWEARVENELSIAIRKLLYADPPPQDCGVARSLREYADLLQFDAHERAAA